MVVSTAFSGIGVAPQVALAEALSSALVRVTFSEEMDVTAALLDPASYTITEDVGSAVRTCVAVYSGGPSAVVLVLDGDLTPGSDNYNVEVAATVVDLAGNGVDPAADNADFGGPGASAELEVNSDGGEIASFVLGLADGEFYVDVGVDPDVSAVRAYSARPGHENRALSEDGILTFAVPQLVPAENYRANVTPVGGGSTVLTGVLFHARRRPLFSATHGLRRVLPARWETGAAFPEEETVP